MICFSPVTLLSLSVSPPSFSSLAAQAKLKFEEASKSEAKFLKMKAWSKSRIRQLEDEVRKSQVRDSVISSKLTVTF